MADVQGSRDPQGRLRVTLFALGILGWVAGDDLAKYLKAPYVAVIVISVVSLVMMNFFSPTAHKCPTVAPQPVHDAYNAGNYALAIEIARKARIPRVAGAWERMAWAQAHYRRGEFAQAEEIARQTLSGSDAKRLSRGLALLVQILAERRQFTEADQALDTASELLSSNGDVPRTRALMSLRQGEDPAHALALVARIAGGPRSIATLAWALAENGHTE